MNDQQEIDDVYLENSFAKYQIDGKKYDIPMGYMWWSRVKYGKWPTPKDEYTNATSFEAFALLPDFLPYSRATAEKFDQRKGIGDIATVSLMAGKFRSFEEIAQIYRETGSVEHLSPESRDFGLVHYLWKPRVTSPESAWMDVYVADKSGPAEFWIQCVRGVPSPDCHLHEVATEHRPKVDVTFSAKFLPSWQIIREKSLSLIDKFSQ